MGRVGFAFLPPQIIQLGPKGQAAMKGNPMGILQILTATEILVFCSIFCIYLFR